MGNPLCMLRYKRLVEDGGGVVREQNRHTLARWGRRIEGRGWRRIGGRCYCDMAAKCHGHSQKQHFWSHCGIVRVSIWFWRISQIVGDDMREDRVEVDEKNGVTVSTTFQERKEII